MPLFASKKLETVAPFGFHPAVQTWFEEQFGAATSPQAQAWPKIKAGNNVLIAAPTGSGKTLAAFLAAIDTLVQRGVSDALLDETAVVYVSPLKALSNDIQRNLEWPLEGIRAELRRLGLPEVNVRTMVRTGDTPQAARELMRRRPPHILVTTPESLYILLSSESGRKMLATTRTAIVDEIHAMAADKRGAHLALSLERLSALTGGSLTRIGLSATQKPIEEVARFLVGAQGRCEIIDTGHVRERDLAIELPAEPLTAVMSGEMWEQVYARLVELIAAHRTTLIFVNTRRLAERLARHLSERIGKNNVTAHHGSLSKELRLDAEQRLKNGGLKALVATASLELGIDIGDVDLVCQIGSPRSIAAFLQRVGRSGHSLRGTPKGRLFPNSRDDLVECAALLHGIRLSELDRLEIPSQPLDVLAQQIVAECASQDRGEDELFELARRAHPYRDLSREIFNQLVRMLAEGYSTRRGQRNAYLHRDAVNRRLRGRRGARLTAITNGGTIPDNADYEVVLEPEAQLVGSVNEDFAIESMAGDIFQLGNQSYRIMRVERGKVRVEDAGNAPPTIPFWLGEAPGRSDELSLAVSRLRARIAELVAATTDFDPVLGWLRQEVGLTQAAAEQLLDYLAAGVKSLGVMPTQEDIVLERFFDETGGAQLVIHSPYGSRINRAWGLSLRKRFCRQFNFELQAAATEDNIVLSLSTSHSFPLQDVARYLNSATVRGVLVQALLAAPMFTARWRWNATTALALLRFRGGKKVPPQFQRIDAEELLAAIFPDQVACAENLTGPIEVPDHPLVNQTIADCLHEAMDIEGLERLLRAIENGAVQIHSRDLTEPSPFALEVLNARPYAFLDDAPLEERRTQAVMSRRWIDPETASDLGKLDPAAIERVRAEAWPQAQSADEMHDALLNLAFITIPEAEANAAWPKLLHELQLMRRATPVLLTFSAAEREGDGMRAWVAAERIPELRAVFAEARIDPAFSVPAEFGARQWTREEALKEFTRSRLQAAGPTTMPQLAATLAVTATDIEIALAALEAEGFVMQGRYTPGAAQIEWCERRLLARIHRYTINRLRAEIEPVAARDYMRFLLRWQHLLPEDRLSGPDGLAVVLAQLEGFEAAAVAWEADILPARVSGYDFAWLDNLCLVGRTSWTRLSAPSNEAAAPVRATPIVFTPRRNAPIWNALAQRPALMQLNLSSRARAVAAMLEQRGASFFADVVEATGLLRTEAEEALAELTANGLISADGFSGLRALLIPSGKRKPWQGTRRRKRSALFGIEDAGRWSLQRRSEGAARPAPEIVEHVARTLLKRYGVVFWRVLEREAEWLPPWRDLVRCYRRLEARGEIRGGRFVAGVTSEQFALPDAVAALRAVRKSNDAGSYVTVSGVDPLNLIGIILPGPKLPALAGNRLLYRDGLPVALLSGGEVQFIEELPPEETWQARNLLLKRPASSPLNAYLP